MSLGQNTLLMVTELSSYKVFKRTTAIYVIVVQFIIVDRK